MSTKNQQSNQYNQAGMNSYNSMMPNFSNAANGYMNSPFSNPFFQTQQQMGYHNAAMQNQSGMSNITRNLGMNGVASNSPAAMEMMNNQMRAGTANSAQQGFLNPVNNAFTAQQNAMGMASSFHPLQTGQTQTQSGLGTWLPQLLGAGLGLLTGGGGGVLAKMFQGGKSGSPLTSGGYPDGSSSGGGGFGLPTSPYTSNSAFMPQYS